MASGVNINDSVITTFNDFKLKHTYKYIVFKLSDDLKEIVCDAQVEEATWDALLDYLPPNECRYICYSFDYVLKDGGKRDKVIMVSWCPDTAVIKKKMVHASSKEALKKKLLGVAFEFHADDKSGLDYNEIYNTVSKGGTQ